MQKSETNYNLIDWWKKVVFENYTNFRGRARRSEFWYFTLGQFLIMIPVYIVIGATMENGEMSTLGIALYLLVLIASLLPTLAVSVRRLHDLGYSGWMYFIILIPFIGSLVLLIFFFTEGQRFTNKWGPDPKDPEGGLQFDFEQVQSH